MAIIIAKTPGRQLSSPKAQSSGWQSSSLADMNVKNHNEMNWMAIIIAKYLDGLKRQRMVSTPSPKDWDDKHVKYLDGNHHKSLDGNNHHQNIWMVTIITKIPG
jgi:hypothetical protein